MKLTTTTQVSVDGVMQGNGGATEEDRRNGFERGGWARPPEPLFDDEAMTCVNEIYQRADAFLFGRRTYELFAGYWGMRDDMEDPVVGALNTQPKYVASTTLTDPQWANTTVLSGDLVDEMNLLIVPVVVGQGARLFPDAGPDIALDLVDSRSFPKGITSQVYRPAGRPEYATSLTRDRRSA
jgi:dihydrofolate reductase